MKEDTKAKSIVKIMKDAGYVMVVRCEDCRWWHESEIHKGFGSCGQANGITLKPFNWFCADGERKGT